MTHGIVLDTMFFAAETLAALGIAAIVIVEILLWKNKSRK